MRQQDARKPLDPYWKRLAPLALTVLLVMALLVWLGFRVFSSPSEPSDDRNGSEPRPGVASSFSVSYASAASRLEGLTKQETNEQLRDWARFGLAARLGMDTGSYRDASYDTLPVRDPGFDGLVRQPTGPGRSLFDGRRNILHVLVPRDDRHKPRTVGQQIDQYRTDTGSDPRSVRVHEYQLRPDARAIRVTSGKPASTARVRSTYGFVTQRVDTADGLKDFLARADHLSSLEQRGQKIWAGGWDWGGKSSVDSEDVSALQRGYTASFGPRPGFSLDPKQPKTARDIRAAFPDLKPQLADDISRGEVPKGLADQVSKALFEGAKAATLREAGLPTDRTRLWALYNLLQGGPAYTQARYEGGLAGTKVGMTLFYTDYVAKHWVSGVGTGVPSKAVGGFVANPQADIPWSECPKTLKQESGRLWFGANTSGFSFSGDRVHIGAQPTRLFARSNNGGTEVEPSYSMGRGLRWWDQHYQDVADYEPQYERLDELMRWSGALDWLTTRQGGARLPQLGDDRITSDLRFKDWYADHDELRERADITFVSPPSAGQEALHHAASKTYKACGLLNISGGVSLADRLSLSGGHEDKPDLPQHVRRAGEFDPESTFDSSTGAGRITQIWKDAKQKVTDRLQHTFSRGKGGSAVVRTVGEPRKDDPFGSLKKVQVGSSEREVGSEISADKGGLRQSVEMNGRLLGRMAATRTVDVVEVRWERGLLDRFRSAAHTVQDRLPGISKRQDAVPGANDVLYGYEDGDGRIQYKMGGKDAPWFSVVKGEGMAGAVMALRLGVPKQDTGTPEFSTAALVPMDGKGPGAPRGPPGDGDGWIEAAPPGGEDRPTLVTAVEPPRESDPSIRVETTEGEVHRVHYVEGRPRVEADDPVFGLNGPAAGAAFLRDFPRVHGALRAADRAEDGLFRAVELGPDGSDGIVLAGADQKAVLVPPDHAWAAKLHHALSLDTSRTGPLIRFTQGTEPRYVGKNSLGPAQDQKAQKQSLTALLEENPGDVYISTRLEAQVFGGKAIPSFPPPRDVTVVVRAFKVQRDSTDESETARPDIYKFGGREWTRIAPGGGNGANGSQGNGGTGKGGSAGPGAGARTGTVLLACAEDETDPGCGDD